MAWDPDQYRRFATERSQPFHDLLDLIAPHDPATGADPVGVRPAVDRAVDLGCGSGELTLLAADRLGVAEMVGIDDSTAMLDQALALDQSGRAGLAVRFELGDIAEWTSDHDHDLVLANASLQWVPDHPAVLTRWVAALRPGGRIAVQVPANADHPSHLASAHVAETEPFRSAMGGEPPGDPVAANVLVPEEYATVLHDIGLIDVHARLQVYGHVLGSSADVVEWTRGTSLTRFFARLPAELHEPFVDAYRRELLARIGDRAPYFYPFKRILLRGCSPLEAPH